MTNDPKTAIASLDPKTLWEYFQEICDVPHPSHHEEKLVEFLKNFGEEQGLETIVDEANNVIIRKPATPGFEDRKMVILQSHTDMVPDKSKTSNHDFLTDPIEAYIDGDWVTANETTLGADNGIGVAATLAILASKDIQHGPIEALFTATEETGMCGASGLKEGVLKGDILLNLDTEEEGEFYIGCAGGVDTDLAFPFQKEAAPAESESVKISVSGLKGGHSGSDIHLGRGNAIKILIRVLYPASNDLDLRLASINVGSPLHNAIPRDGEAYVTIPKANYQQFEAFVKKIADTVLQELTPVDDAGIKIDIEKVESIDSVMQKEEQVRLLEGLYGCPHGVIDMSPTVPGLVQTSTNLGHVRTENDTVIVYTLQRGSVDSLKDEVANTVYCIFKLTGGTPNFANIYSGWDPNMHSEIVKLMKEVYMSLYGKEPEIKAIHAGLECGLIGCKYPNLDMISIGPTLLHPHSPDEKVNIPSVKKFWDLILETLQKIPSR